MSESQNRLICLIPHYNNPEALVRSLASIGPSEQCDVLVVDDGSARAPVAEAAARAAFRAQGVLRFLYLPQNRGIEHALNSGLNWILARGYARVARLDCGDTNRPDRFARQMAFLDTHPEVALVGGAASMIDPQTRAEQFVLRHPAEHAAIVRTMRRNSAFIHPAVMFNTTALATTGLYPLDAPAAEDYALFWQFVRHFQTANLADVVIDYELDPGSISHSKRDIQLRSRLQLQWRHRAGGGLAAYVGMLRTLAILLLPYRLIFKLKSRLRNKASS
ncbi:lipooligosaccharide biosynthesis galactosyltransferase LsgF [Silvimonas sp. JCM 19000]